MTSKQTESAKLVCEIPHFLDRWLTRSQHRCPCLPFYPSSWPKIFLVSYSCRIGDISPSPWPLESSESESGIKSYGWNTLIVLDSKGILVIFTKPNHFISGPKLKESVEGFDTNPLLFESSKFESVRKSYARLKFSVFFPEQQKPARVMARNG